MLVSAQRITMTAGEWAEFSAATFAPWVPRTVAEFNAMCALAQARHLADDTGGVGFLHAMAVQQMQFGPEGEINFPVDHRRLAYLQVHGAWPTPQQLEDFEANPGPRRPGLTIVR